MCIVCQAFYVGAATLTGVLPMAVPEPKVVAPVPVAASQTATQPASIGGATCGRTGQVRRIGDSKFKCVSVGSRRLWRRVAGPASTTTTAPNTTTTVPRKLIEDPRISPMSSLIDSTACKMPDMTFWQGQLTSSGFPRSPFRPSSKKTLSVFVLPIAFADIPFDRSNLTRLVDATTRVRDYFRSVSYGQADITWTFASESEWIRYNENADYFRLITGPKTMDKTTFIADVLSRTSPTLGLSNYDAIAIQTAFDARSNFGQGFTLDPSTAFKTPSGRVMSVVFDGGTNGGSWASLAHELGHGWLGFEDLYHFQTPSSAYFNYWDLMNAGGSRGAELTVWHRFLVGWVSDSQIRCVPRGSGLTTHFISALPVKNDLPKGVTFQLSAGRMLVIESRRTGGFDSAGSTALVYVVDTNIPHSQAPFRLIGELTRIGQQVSVSGIDVTLLNADDTGDLVSISVGLG